MAAKQHKAKGRISYSSEEEDDSDTRDNTDLDQVNDKYQLQYSVNARQNLDQILKQRSKLGS